jgi:hypothetical protein
MTSAVAERPARELGRSCGDVQPLGRGGVTLAELLTETLTEARANGTAECPVCHAEMALTGMDAGCGGCGSRLS